MKRQIKINDQELFIRPLEMADLGFVHALHSLPETDRFNTLGIPANLSATKNLMSAWLQSVAKKEKYILTITSGNSGGFVGLAGINHGKPGYNSAEIWYKLEPRFWNKGFATAVVREALDFCFNDLHLHRVEAGCATANVASARVLEKCGFTREAHTRKLLPIRGEWVDNFGYAILDEDFRR